MTEEHAFDPPPISDELQILICLYALDSAFDRILKLLSMLKAKMTLQPELAQANIALIEAVRAAINLEFRETLGETGMEQVDAFSKNARRMEKQLIDECLSEAHGQNAIKPDA